jgi:hypothetical protein
MHESVADCPMLVDVSRTLRLQKLLVPSYSLLSERS